MKCRFLLLLFLFNFGILCYGKFNGNRIMNGKEAAPGKYQNVVRLVPIAVVEYPTPTGAKTGYPGVFFSGLCSSTLISKRHILTAAHCVTTPHAIPVSALIGTFLDYRPIKINSGTLPHNVTLKEVGFATKFHYHEGWHWQLFQDDIAIIELPYEITDIEPVLLAGNYEEGKNDIGINLGYGDTDIHPAISERAKVLMEINLPIFPKKACFINNETHPNICAGNSTHRAGEGDSGGPLFFDAADGKQYQIGVAHDLVTNEGRSNVTHPDFTTFMRLSAYCDWIFETTNGEAKCVEIPKKNDPVPPIPKPPPINPSKSTQSPTNPLKPNSTNETTEITPNKGHTEPQKADENDYGGDDNGAMSKNICIIIVAFIFATVLNV